MLLSMRFSYWVMEEELLEMGCGMRVTVGHTTDSIRKRLPRIASASATRMPRPISNNSSSIDCGCYRCRR